jgi:hypothetical protein
MSNATKISQKMSKTEFSFKKGFDQVPVGKVPELRANLMKALDIKSYPAWLRRLRGEVDPKASEIRAVEEVFSTYGIKKIWGE